MSYPRRPEGVTDQTIRRSLKIARKRIANGKCNLICLTLGGNHLPTINYLQEYITFKLDGYGTYGSWYRHERNNNVSLSYAKLKEHRLAWIDWMLEGLK